MTPWDVLLGALIGFAAGVLSGLFGVGGGIVTTPTIQHFLGAAPIQAVATPLPIIFPTSAVGAYTYWRAGEVDARAAVWAAGLGVLGTIVGAALTDVVNADLLLLITAILLGWTAVQVLRGRRVRDRERGASPGWQYGAVGLAAGFISGLLGVGGGIVMVPAFTTLLGMPLKRALGTSLLVIAVLVVPGTLVHWALGHIDWAIFLVVAIGVVPGARLGARIALGAREHALRIAVGSFLLCVALAYGASELYYLVTGRG
jgi:uncharacterized membrane protein YfcA